MERAMSGILPGEFERVRSRHLARSKVIRAQTPHEQVQLRGTLDLGGRGGERFGVRQFDGQMPNGVTPSDRSSE
jgi:hypothetical protein